VVECVEEEEEEEEEEGCAEEGAVELEAAEKMRLRLRG
jgi:hypothetical protein